MEEGDEEEKWKKMGGEGAEKERKQGAMHQAVIWTARW